MKNYHTRKNTALKFGRKIKRTNYKPRYTVYSVKWTFHLTDDDPKPTIPHGHGEYKGETLKLSLWDGEITRLSGKKWIHKGWASKSDMQMLYNDQMMETFAEEARKWYIKNHKITPDLKPRRGDIGIVKRIRNRLIFRNYRNQNKLRLESFAIELECYDDIVK